MSEPQNAPRLLEIVRLGGEGDGIAEGPEGPVYIPRALPGEQYAAEPDASFRLASAPSPERRATPLCPHYPACGGCTVQHMAEPLYRTWKAGLLTAAFARAGIDIAPEPMISVSHHSRRRATLTGRHGPRGFVFGYYAHASHDIVPLTACAVLHPAITSALPLLADVAARAAPRPDGEARLSVLVCREGLDLTISGGRRPANAALLADLARIATSGPIARITLNGEPAVQRTRPTVRCVGVDVAPPPAAFLQAVEEAETHLAALVLEALPKRVRRIADLFAGLGTFTLALAARAPVEAFDSDRRLVDALSAAARGARGVKPIETKVRDLFLDPLSPRELSRFDAVVFDPPRAGAKAQAEAIARCDVARVVAVSCNPATLARDTKIMIDAGWRMERITAVDQFLYTPHLEVVAVLAR